MKLAAVCVRVSPTAKPRIQKRYGVPFQESEAALCVRAADGTRPARKRQSVFADRHTACGVNYKDTLCVSVISPLLRKGIIARLTRDSKNENI